VSVVPITRAFDGLASRIDSLGVRSVGFTSALLGEGVSTIALGTALGLSDLRKDAVLLVDANWQQPSLTSDAGLAGEPGLAELLAHQAQVETLIRTQASRIAFLPIGDRACGRPTLRALGSFLEREAGEFETVVVDLPPILAGEPFVLPWAALLEQICVVLREGATPLPVVREALSRLHVANPPYVILNRANASSIDVPARAVAALT